MATITGTPGNDQDSSALIGGIENDLIEGLDGDDELRGREGDDTLRGGPGADLLDGDAGDDWLLGGNGDDLALFGNEGNDTIDGGAGFDDVEYGGDPAGVDVDLAAGTATDGHGDTDTLLNVEGVVGSDFADSLRGDANDNFLSGLEGDDTLIGRGGNDFITGREGDDLILAGGGDDDALFGGAGDDTIDGGAGFDEVEYGDDPAGVTVDLAAGTATDGHGDTDTLRRIESVFGSDFADTLRGDDGDNFLGGLAGDDLIEGGGGADRINGYGGSDTLDGGDGIDELAFFGAPEGVLVDLGRSIARIDSGEEDTISNFENVDGTDFADVLRGDGGRNILDGFDGDDLLVGRRGRDLLWGGNGDDTLKGGAGNDVVLLSPGEDDLRGGAGRDTIAFSSALANVPNGEATGVIDLAGGTGGTLDGTLSQTLRGFENVVAFDPDAGVAVLVDLILTGNAKSNVLVGGRGADTIEGGDGDDGLEGAPGADRLDGGAGNDELEGGTGADVFVFAATAEADWGRDTVLDFDTAATGERLAISGPNEAADFDAFLAASEDTEDGLVYDAGDDGDNVIVLSGVVRADLTADHVDFG